MVNRVFVDGQSGTCGLEIQERLRKLDDVILLSAEEHQRKVLAHRVKLAKAADVVITCLPDEASRELVEQMPPDARILDCSTAFRTNSSWIYGLPEMAKDQRAQIKQATRVSNPGCYPTGVILLLKPLLESGLLKASAEVTIYAQSGYSGAGKALIQAYESPTQMHAQNYQGARRYAMDFNHKHLAEMHSYTGLETKPLFLPSVGNYYRGMLVEIPVRKNALKKGVSGRDVFDCWIKCYAKDALIVIEKNSEQLLDDRYLNPNGLAGKDHVELGLFGDADNLLLTARLDNLNKGAAGAAIQNLNLMLGMNELAGLNPPVFSAKPKAQATKEPLHELRSLQPTTASRSQIA